MTSSQCRKIGICVVGCGGISEAHLQAYVKHPGTEVVAVVDVIDRQAKRAAERWGARFSYTDYRKALERNDVHLVDICLPHCLHSEVSINAAEAGKHILIEKPMATSLNEADAMIEAARRNGVKLMVNQNKRFQTRHQRIKGILDEGLIGKMILAKSFYPQFIYDYLKAERGWMASKKQGGGALMTLGIHNVDLLRWFVGDVIRVSAMLSRSKFWPKGGGEDTGIILMEFENGAIGEVTISFSLKNPFVRVDPNVMPLMLFGEIGSVQLDFDNHLLVFSEKLSDKPWGLIDIPVKELPWIVEKDSFYKAIDHMVSCILDNQEPLISGEEGRKSLEIIVAASKSFQEKRTISLPLQMDP